MTTYVALLRGIGPGNPNMHQKKLVGAFEKLGFKNVRGVISSGNVVFESSSKNISALEKKIEQGLLKHLGFSRAAIVRSRAELGEIIQKNPFNGKIHSTKSYLLVSFLKDRNQIVGGTLFTEVDVSKGTPEFMNTLEKKYGKEITSRTWKTVERIVKKMEE